MDLDNRFKSNTEKDTIPNTLLTAIEKSRILRNKLKNPEISKKEKLEALENFDNNWKRWRADLSVNPEIQKILNENIFPDLPADSRIEAEKNKKWNNSWNRSRGK